MNSLLWWQQYGGSRDINSLQAPDLVWEKILSAPDASNLDVYYRGKRVGFCRWVPNILGLTDTNLMSDTDTVGARIKQVAGYTIDTEVNFYWPSPTNRWRGFLHVELGPNRSWREFQLRLQVKPGLWEFQAWAATQTLRLKYSEPDVFWEREFAFAELVNPGKIWSGLGLPGAWASPWGTSLITTNQISAGMNWQAYRDLMSVGHSRLRVYRLESRLLDRYTTQLWVSRSGELLRIDTPLELRLINEILSGWRGVDRL